MASKAKQALQKADRLLRQGRSRDAAQLYRKIMAAFPNGPEARRAQRALSGLEGVPDATTELRMLYATGRHADLVAKADRLPPTVRNQPMVQTLIGGAQMALGRPDAAELAFRATVQAAPDRAAGHANLGLALQAQGKLDAAQDSFATALRLQPDHAGAHNGLGMVHQDRGETGKAEAAFATAARLNPADPEIWTNLGNAHQQAGRLGKAIDAYRTALDKAPNHANAHYNYGLALRAQGQVADAVDHYRHAITARPGFAMAHNNLGNALHALNRAPEAEAPLREAARLSPGNAEILNNLACVLRTLGRFDAAVDMFDAAIRADPGFASAKAARLFLLAQMCDWRAQAKFAAEADSLGITGGPVFPFDVLSLEDDPRRQRLRAARYSQAEFPAAAPPHPAPAVRTRPERLRVGYFSADFRSHPVARLIAGTFAAHDRDRFELLAYSFGPDRSDALRSSLSAEFTRFTDIRALPDDAAAQLVQEDALDIAIDLTCHTQHSRTGLFARRVAPVQINYLGFPGTSGAPFMDYIIADSVLIPEGAEADHATEAVIRLPHSYQPNDDRRAVPADATTRADHGLPDDAFVLCSFNSAYKVTEREFSIWMRVLSAVPDAVLWLLDATGWARKALTQAAVAHGIDPARIIFAPRADNTAHLARHRHADLFLDTFAYNAHTTGSDALWMGVPVVTLCGHQFAARVCASLLHAVGLPELIANTETEYETLILDLANDRDRVATLHQRLQAARGSAPLFATKAHTRGIEAALDAVHARWRNGGHPTHLNLSADLSHQFIESSDTDRV